MQQPLAGVAALSAANDASNAQLPTSSATLQCFSDAITQSLANGNGLNVNTHTTTTSTCYPVTESFNLVFRTTYTATECKTGAPQFNVMFLNWLMKDQNQEAPLIEAKLGPLVSASDATTAKKIELLESIRCDDMVSPGTILRPRETLNAITPGSKGIIFAITGIAFVVSVVALVWTLMHMNIKSIKVTQPSILAFVCIGCIISMAAIIPMSIDDIGSGISPLMVHTLTPGQTSYLNLMCQMHYLLYVTGFGISFGALFAKMYRIKGIIMNKKLRVVRITFMDVMGCKSRAGR